MLRHDSILLSPYFVASSLFVIWSGDFKHSATKEVINILALMTKSCNGLKLMGAVVLEFKQTGIVYF